MFEKMKLWWAKQQLAAARNHEAQMRASADRARDHILPALEAQVREMESRRNFRTFHKGRSYQWAGRTTDRLPLDRKVYPLTEGWR